MAGPCFKGVCNSSLSCRSHQSTVVSTAYHTDPTQAPCGPRRALCATRAKHGLTPQTPKLQTLLETNADSVARSWVHQFGTMLQLWSSGSSINPAYLGARILAIATQPSRTKVRHLHPLPIPQRNPILKNCSVPHGQTPPPRVAHPTSRETHPTPRSAFILTLEQNGLECHTLVVHLLSYAHQTSFHPQPFSCSQRHLSAMAFGCVL